MARQDRGALPQGSIPYVDSRHFGGAESQRDALCGP